jgi:hypothetical protein
LKEAEEEEEKKHRGVYYGLFNARTANEVDGGELDRDAA